MGGRSQTGSCSGRSGVGRGGVSELGGPGDLRGRFLFQYFSKHLAGCSFVSLTLELSDLENICRELLSSRPLFN